MNSGDIVMNRTKKTAINALANLLSILLSSFASFFMVRVVLERMGSDYNGLNQTVTQLIAILTIFEGSFTAASLIALYKPFGVNNSNGVSIICSTAKRAFIISGIILLTSGIIFALIYSSFIKTAYSYITIVLIFIISIISTVFSSMFASKYRLLFQVTQTEYVLTIISTIGNLLSHLAAYIYLKQNNSIIHLRLIYTLFPILMNVIILILGKRRFPKVDFSKRPDYSTIKGTKDLMISALTGAIYKSTPFLFISSFSGTIYTSVYSVYSSVFNLVESTSYAFFSAPRNGIGQLISEKNEDKIKGVFCEFEHLCLFIISILLSAVGGVIMSFIKIYTAGISDVQYVDYFIAYLILVSIYVQFMHMPSGLFINMSGHFKAIKNIQLLAAAVLIVLDIIGAIAFGIYGILVANLLTGILLAFLEIRYARKEIVHLSNNIFLKLSTIFGCLSIILIFLFNAIFSKFISSYFQFLYIGIFVFIISVAAFSLVSYLFFRSETKALFVRFKYMVIRRRDK